MAIPPGRHDTGMYRVAEALGAGLAAVFDQNKTYAHFEYAGYSDTSKASLPTCEESCRACQEQYMPEEYVQRAGSRERLPVHSDHEARGYAHHLVESTRQDQEFLRRQLILHADVFTKRWETRGQEARVKMLRNAMPEMYGQNMAPVRLYYDQKRMISGAMAGKDFTADTNNNIIMPIIDLDVTQGRKRWLMPYLDTQTLSEQSSIFLALLHYRTTADLEEWVPFDIEQLRIVFNGCRVQTVYYPHCVVMYGKHYGRLIQWNMDSAHRRDIVGYPMAALVLEAQHDLCGFLRRMVEQLLSPVSSSKPVGNTLWQTRVSGDFLSRTGGSPPMKRTLAYRSPPKYDIDNIVDLISQRLESLTDQAWLLQTDPLYFRSYLARLKDTAYKHAVKDEHWRQGVSVMQTFCYLQWCDAWKTTLEQAEFVSRLQKAAVGSVQPGKPLPKQYHAVLVLFEGHLTKLY